MVAVVFVIEIVVDPAATGVKVAVLLDEPPEIVACELIVATPVLLLVKFAVADIPPATCSSALKLPSAFNWANPTMKAVGPAPTVVVKNGSWKGAKTTSPEGTCVILAVLFANPVAAAV